MAHGATEPPLCGRGASWGGGHVQGCLHPGKLRACFPAPAPSWSTGPTTERGLHQAPHAQVGGLGSARVWDSEGVLLQPRAGVCSLPQEEGLYFILGRGVMEGQTAAPSRALKDGVKGR